jgi:hypothetical protein
VRLGYVMTYLGLWRPRNAPPGPISDANISVVCPACRTRQTLMQAKYERQPALSTYTCARGCPDPLLSIHDDHGKPTRLAVHAPSGMKLTLPPSVRISPN